ncbi:hypothetical protein [Peribacillus frigoritolerans]|uniref:hypothetical protein n=1 Tax=Peribacillus frigoritolerans TaxID=450367 RepID=UPI00105A7921|nr:hypothetical protein [Peribacillus frigoritolerans]TDL82094.1 hypothetical protein E2R53_00450 [Peribacillus frigoritolerans]
MDKTISLFEATSILEEYYITESPQMVARWLREGRIEGESPKNRKEGWRISQNSLFKYIEKERPGLIDRVIFCEEHIEREISNSRSKVGEVKTQVELNGTSENNGGLFEEIAALKKLLMEITETQQTMLKKFNEINKKRVSKPAVSEGQISLFDEGNSTDEIKK